MKMANPQKGLWSKPAQDTGKQLQPACCEEIACVAYGLYEQRGWQDGRDVEDWLRAEEIVRVKKQGGKS